MSDPRGLAKPFVAGKNPKLRTTSAAKISEFISPTYPTFSMGSGLSTAFLSDIRATRSTTRTGATYGGGMTGGDYKRRQMALRAENDRKAEIRKQQLATAKAEASARAEQTVISNQRKRKRDSNAFVQRVITEFTTAQAISAAIAAPDTQSSASSLRSIEFGQGLADM